MSPSRATTQTAKPLARIRVALGVLVLAALVAIAALLAPPYITNWKLQRYVSAVADDPATASRAPDVVRAMVVNEAARLGVPLHGADVHVTRTDAGAVHVEALYVVHVALPVYAVDLHFRPRAG